MKKKPDYGFLSVIPIQGLIPPDHIIPSDFLFVAASPANILVVTGRGNNVIAENYID